MSTVESTLVGSKIEKGERTMKKITSKTGKKTPDTLKKNASFHIINSKNTDILSESVLDNI